VAIWHISDTKWKKQAVPLADIILTETTAKINPVVLDKAERNPGKLA